MSARRSANENPSNKTTIQITVAAIARCAYQEIEEITLGNAESLALLSHIQDLRRDLGRAKAYNDRLKAKLNIEAAIHNATPKSVIDRRMLELSQEREEALRNIEESVKQARALDVVILRQSGIARKRLALQLTRKTAYLHGAQDIGTTP